MKTDVLLADDHPIFLKAMRNFLEPVCRILGTAPDGEAMIALAEKLRPRIAIIDLYMPRLGGLDACERLLALLPETKVILLGVGENLGSAEEALGRGACGYVLKISAEAELLKAVEYVRAGQLYVTPLITSAGLSDFMARAFSLRRASGRRNSLPAAPRPADKAARACLPAEKKSPASFS
jgi:DNA-binding NarL/FixJ family response regulator